MPTSPRKKLIEVAIPLAAINAEASRDKSLRHGHPTTLHVWWAWRPLAACRAVLFAQLVDDPSAWPEVFRGNAAQERERRRLFGIVQDLVVWENSNDDRVISVARREIARSLARARGEATPSNADVGTYLTAHAPLVVDPFCGRGAIPLEAQRLGLDALGSDLNPVAVVITKSLVEIPPRFAGRAPINPDSREHLGDGSWAGQGASGLAEDVRYYGQWMRSEAEKRIGHLYPKVEVTNEMAASRQDLEPYAGRRLTVIAWLWARTVASPNPAADGAHVPLVSSFVLSSKKGKLTVVVPIIEDGGYRFTVKSGGITPDELAIAKSGTKNSRGANFNCLMSDAPMSDKHIKSEGTAGRMGVRLMAVVAQGHGERVYLSPTEEMESLAHDVEPGWRPRQELAEDPKNIWCPAYGLTKFEDLFTERQLVALTTFSDLVGEARALVQRDYLKTMPILPADELRFAQGGNGSQAYADAVVTYLAMAVDRLADRGSTLCTWDSSPKMQALRNTFGRHALPMTWDFAEGNPFSGASGNWLKCVDWIRKVVGNSPYHARSATVLQRDAATTELPKGAMVATDPPYYDNIGYAGLSDFFYIWLRRSMSAVHPDLFRTLLTPKTDELVAAPRRFDGNRALARRFFEGGLGQATAHMRASHAAEFPMTVFYAYKQAEAESSVGTKNQASTGWETMLTGIVDNGFSITGTWPVRTELRNRMLAGGTNALASSIVLACRLRSPNAPTSSRREFVAVLEDELPIAIRRLQAEKIAPVDLAQAAIGPGMAVFSRYAQVLEAHGEPMSVRRALVEINRVLDETLTAAESDVDADTRFCIAWFEQYGMDERPYGEAEVLFTAKNTSFEGLEHAGVLVGGAGKVRLKRRDELNADWDPETDDRIADWECTQHLVHAMTAESGGGVERAARLATAMGPGRAETARNLAYRLHAVSERQGWTAEALAYNILATSWPQIQSEIARQATTGEQPEFDL